MITIVDIGLGNLNSIKKALDYLQIKDQILGQKWNCTYKDHIILRSINEIIIK